MELTGMCPEIEDGTDFETELVLDSDERDAEGPEWDCDASLPEIGEEEEDGEEEGEN